MKAVNELLKNTRFNSHDKDYLFMLSIRKIADDVMLREMKNGKEIRTIAIISPFSHDGKSEISDHLSYEFAGMGCKTLLLCLQKAQEAGCDLEEPIQPDELPEYDIANTGIKNLDYLCLESLKKSNGFTSSRNTLSSLLGQLKNRYKRIIIDTASLDGDVSGFIAASAADGAYFICSRRNMRKGQLEKYYECLKDVGANILGIIYNNAERKTVKKMYIQNGEKYA